MKQKSIIVSGRDNGTLNEYLAAGWTVVSMCAMPSSCTGDWSKAIDGQCLVIIQK
jgi:hypothetical protein